MLLQVEGPDDTEYVKIQLEGDSKDILTVERRFTEKVSREETEIRIIKSDSSVYKAKIMIKVS